MRSISSTFLFACLFMAGFHAASAQSPRQAILVNGNLFMAGNHATIASYNLSTNTYTVFDSIPARFCSDVVIDNNFAFVAADSLLLRYNIDTYQLAGSVVVPGLRKLAIANGKVFVTTGYGGNSDHLQIFNSSTLQPLGAVSGISGDCEGILHLNDTAYIAVPGSFGNPIGSIAMVNTLTNSLVQEVNLDSNGRGIEKIYAYGGKLWTVNPIAFGNPFGYVTEFNPIGYTFVHHRIEYNTLHSPGFFGNHLYLRRGADGVFAFDPSTGLVSDPLVISGNFAGGAIDTVNQEYLMTETDFFSYGKLWRFDAQGNIIDSLNVGISPEYIAIDYRGATAREDVASTPELAIWPVPAKETLHLRLHARMRVAQVEILDLQGRVLSTSTLQNATQLDLDVAKLPAGCYIVRVSGNGQQLQGRFVK